MANLTASLIKAEIKINNVIRRAFLNNARLFLLKRAGQTKRFEIVEEIQDGWFFEFNKEFRDEAKVSIATLVDISDITAQSSFLAYGTGQADDEIDVFSFAEKDVVKPNAASPSWSIYVERAPTESFVIPVGSPPPPAP